MSEDVIATSKREVGKSPIDYYSWGHLAFGMMTFILLSLINTIPTLASNNLIYTIPYWWMIVIAVGVFIIWEILENTLLVEMGFKFEGRRDSLKNALSDIVFGFIGGLFIWILKGVIVNFMGVAAGDLAAYIGYFYIVSLIAFGVMIIALLIGKAMTK